MKRILIDVDTQFDFVAPEGSLFVPAPDAVPAQIATLLAAAASEGTPILGSVDSHAHDAWEFAAHGGPFPAHCVKGTPGWLRVHHGSPRATRFIPMQPVHEGRVENLVGEAREGKGARILSATDLATEAMNGVGIYFEKEVYSLFSNPAATPVIAELVQRLGGPDAVRFDVIGYCTGGYCVDAAVHGLIAAGYRVRVLGDATAAIGGEEGATRSRHQLTAAGAEWSNT